MASTSKITINGVKYAIKDKFLRDEIKKLQDVPAQAGTGIDVSEDGTVSLKEEDSN